MDATRGEFACYPVRDGGAPALAARCAACGQETKLRQGLRTPGGAARALRVQFNRCHECGRFVCDDCFLGDYALCAPCARARGLTGRVTSGREVTGSETNAKMNKR